MQQQKAAAVFVVVTYFVGHSISSTNLFHTLRAKAITESTNIYQHANAGFARYFLSFTHWFFGSFYEPDPRQQLYRYEYLARISAFCP